MLDGEDRGPRKGLDDDRRTVEPQASRTGSLERFQDGGLPLRIASVRFGASKRRTAIHGSIPSTRSGSCDLVSLNGNDGRVCPLNIVEHTEAKH